MNRMILAYALLFTATGALGAQEAGQSNPYQGTSTPPADDTIETTTAPQPQLKPRAGKPTAPVQDQAQTPPQSPTLASATTASTTPVVTSSDPDSGIVMVQQSAPASEQPEPAALATRNNDADPDGDIVHPRALRPGELPEGVTIRVKLLDRLSSVSSEKGETFRSRVASDVVQGGQVLIPAGTEIDGRVASVSTGHPGGHGSMRLQPETLILANGTRYQFRADITGTPGAKSKVGNEGTILPASRLKRDGIEYGGAVGGGAVAGAIVAGPVGAMTGSLIGAGVITAHLLVDHPQATLEPGTVMLFTLSEPLQMAPVGVSGN
ncbi:MAG: hypothetical protein ABSF70_10825 [Terracidiphilus sp.]